MLSRPGRLGVVRDEDVLGLDVTVDDTPGMRVFQRIDQGQADAENLLVLEFACGDQPRQRLPLHQLGDQVEGLAERAGLVEGDDRGMRQACGGLRLTCGPFAVAVGAQPDPLDGDLTVEQLIPRPPDDSETAGAEALEQPVALQNELLAGPRGPCGGAWAAGPERPATGRLLGCLGRRGRLDEGVVRLHRLGRSPPAVRSPARPPQEKPL